MWAHVGELIALSKADTGNTFGRNAGCICKIHLNFGLRANLSFSLEFEVEVYMKLNSCQGNSGRCILEAPGGQHPNDCCPSVGRFGESLGFGVIQTGVWLLSLLCIDWVSSGKLLSISGAWVSMITWQRRYESPKPVFPSSLTLSRTPPQPSSQLGMTRRLSSGQWNVANVTCATSEHSP